MNEIRDVIVGIDFGKQYSQICYYDRKAGQPRSMSMKVGSNQYEAPSILCKRTDYEEYCVGLEAEYFGSSKDGILLENLYEICAEEKTVMFAGEQKEPWELLSIFLGGMLKFLGLADIVKNIKCLVVTVAELSNIQLECLKKACQALGFSLEKCMFLDYQESFYYYVLTQGIETKNRSVAWYDFHGNQVLFRKFVPDSSKKPILVRILPPTSVQLSAEPEARDLEYCHFIQETLKTEPFSSIQITGYGFDQGWAQRSVKLLCHGKRKVFYGNTLFAMGACAAAAERLEKRELKAYRYFSNAMVLSSIGMDMRVVGTPVYYTLIEAGSNWYECRAHCEIILDDIKELIFSVSSIDGPGKKRVVMHLPGLPERPNKTTRLSLDLEYISPEECQITVKDLGLGELFPSSGKVWTEITKW